MLTINPILITCCILMSTASFARTALVPFLSLEGSYNALNTLPSINPNTQPIGGRASIGFLTPMQNNFSFSSEIAYNYFGKWSIDNSFGYKESYRIDGEDIIIGVLYQWHQINWFVKGGALLQNLHATRKPLTNLAYDAFNNSKLNIRTARESIFPLIKLGGQLKPYSNLYVSLAYQHVFGGSLGPGLSIIDKSKLLAIEEHLTNPTIDAIMLGLAYTFSF